jgi:hypothetical protein
VVVTTVAAENTSYQDACLRQLAVGALNERLLTGNGKNGLNGCKWVFPDIKASWTSGA